MITPTFSRVLLSTRSAFSHSPYLIRIRTLKTATGAPLYTFPVSPKGTHLISLLPSNPPNSSLALGTTTTLPPTPKSFTPNPSFLPLLHSTISAHAHTDPQVIAQAAALASSSAPSPSSQILIQPSSRPARNRRRLSGSEGGGGGASDQGGAGGGGQGGYIHVSDLRHPPDFGRIAEPEDIFGSLEVDADGGFTDGTGKYAISGTYRLVTNDGILGLSEQLMGHLKQRLEMEERMAGTKSDS